MSLWNDDPNVMLVAAHRGARRIQPENTMTAFRYAVSLGVDMIETDVRQTRDGALVLMHDSLVDRTTDGTGTVRSMSRKEFLALNAAAHDEGFAPEAPAQLEELLELTASTPGLLLNIELKEYPHVEGPEASYDTADKTVAMLERYGLGQRVILNSFSGALLLHLRQKYGKRYPLHGFYPDFYLGPDHGDPASYLDVACLLHGVEKDGKHVSLEDPVCPQSWFDEVRRRGVEPWVGAGVRTKEALAASFDRGARLVTADDPGAVLGFLRQLGHHK